MVLIQLSRHSLRYRNQGIEATFESVVRAGTEVELVVDKLVVVGLQISGMRLLVRLVTEKQRSH